MRRFLAWRGLDDEWRAEACTAELGADGLRASGVQLAAAYRLDYELRTTSDLLTEHLLLELHGAGAGGRLDLRRDPGGTWTANGVVQPHVEGALDCDLAFSPLTNYMPARRLGSEPVDGLYTIVEVPSLEVRPSRQRYEPIDERRVRFVSLDSDFTAELELDEDGLVVRYPRLAELVPSAARA
jgi:hypothetical protein